MAEVRHFPVGRVVWAKMGSFRPWPGRVADPPESAMQQQVKPDSKWIYFFGTKNYAWVSDNLIWLYDDKKKKFSKKKGPASFVKAVDEANEFLRQMVMSGEAGSSRYQAEVAASNSSDKEVYFSEMPFYNQDSTSSSDVQESISSSDMQERASTTSDTQESMSVETSEENLGARPKTGISKKGKSKKGTCFTVLGRRSIPISEVRNDPSLQPHVFLSPLPPEVSEEGSQITVVTSKDLAAGKFSSVKHKFGVLGLGNVGRELVANALKSGHKITVWNRKAEKCAEFAEMGAKVGKTPGEVFSECDITFCCVAYPAVAKQLIFMEEGILPHIKPGKGLVMLTAMDPPSTLDIAEVVTMKGGKYLDSPLHGPLTPGKRDSVSLSSGDKDLFESCRSMFACYARSAVFLGEVGRATKGCLILNTFMASTMTALAEGMALAERVGVSQEDLLQVLKTSQINAPLLLDKGRAMVDKNFTPKMPLEHLQQNVNFTLNLSSELSKPMPISASANEVLIAGKNMKYAKHDVAAVYMPSLH